MKKNDLVPALIWMGLGISVAAESSRLKLGNLHNPGPGLMPFLLGIALLFCSLPILIGSLRMTIRKAKKSDEAIWSEIKFKNLILVLVSLIGYALLLEAVGYVLTAFLVLLILFNVVESQKWTVTLALSLLTVISTYLLFVVILKVELPPGLLRIR